jgi:hypothetical protein
VVILPRSQLVLNKQPIAFPKICENALLGVHFIKMFNLKVRKISGKI